MTTDTDAPVLAADSGGHDPETGRFLPGNPGRPKGVRLRLTQEFVRVLADDFAEHGAAVIAKVRQDDPRVTCGRSLHCAAVLNVRAPDIKAVQLQRSLMRAADEIYSPVETRQAD